MLLRAVQLASQVPFQWGYIDKPQDGSLFMIFLVPQQHQFPNDGIRYQGQEVRQVISRNGLELEVCEIKYGFIPDSPDGKADRIRRRFRLLKGGHPQLVLIHYLRGHDTKVNPALMGLPTRAYPLRPVNEPAMYVLGEKAGQKVYQPQQQTHAAGMPTALGAVPSGMQHQAALLAAQSREMEALERRQARDRNVNMAGHAQAHDDESGDEYDHISTRSLALARYKRNHDFMNEVFMYAAFGDREAKETLKTYSCFDEAELKEKSAKLEKELEELKTKAAALKEEAQQSVSAGVVEVGDVSMGSLGPAPVETSA